MEQATLLWGQTNNLKGLIFNTWLGIVNANVLDEHDFCSTGCPPVLGFWLGHVDRRPKHPTHPASSRPRLPESQSNSLSEANPADASMTRKMTEVKALPKPDALDLRNSRIHKAWR